MELLQIFACQNPDLDPEQVPAKMPTTRGNVKALPAKVRKAQETSQHRYHTLATEGLKLRSEATDEKIR